MGNRKTCTHHSHVRYLASLHNEFVSMQGDAQLLLHHKCCIFSAIEAGARPQHTNLRFLRHSEFVSLQGDAQLTCASPSGLILGQILSLPLGSINKQVSKSQLLA